MYYKVFINHTEIAFSNRILPDYKQAVFSDFSAFVSRLKSLDVAAANQERWCVLDANFDYWKAFKKAHKLILAAGGVVVDDAQNLLVIKRLGKWDLPKGKLEAGEEIAECAVREVEEECAVSGLELAEKLPDTFHTYSHKGHEILKQTHWFKMYCKNATEMAPQVEEDIEEVCFFGPKQVREIALKNTYNSLVPLFNTYLSWHK